MSFSDAEEFVDTCELGQTEEGSFGVVVRCPLQVPDDQSLAKDVPFGRRTTDTLFTSVSTLVRAIDSDRVESIINPGPADVRLSANLCDALIKMQPGSEDANIELSVSWASALPHHSGTPDSVKIRAELFPRIADVSKRLRGPTAVQSAPFLARVDVLSGTEMDGQGRRYGEVKLSLLLGENDEIVRARATLDAEQYNVAAEAHMRNRYVVITGVINLSARPARVSAVTDFRLTSDQLLVSPAR